MATVGACTKEKLHNMVAWLSKNVELDERALARVREMSEMQAVMLAQEMVDAAGDGIEAHSFATLSKVELPSEVLSILNAVESAEHLHDKFWRYMELFRELCGGATFSNS